MRIFDAEIPLSLHISERGNHDVMVRNLTMLAYQASHRYRSDFSSSCSFCFFAFFTRLKVQQTPTPSSPIGNKCPSYLEQRMIIHA